jgi:hypothetical protein
MFKVTEGRVQRVAPIFGRKVFNRDGSVDTYTDDVAYVTDTESRQGSIL